MTKSLKRIRGAVGMGLTWGVAWGIAGNFVMLGFLLKTGSRPDAPFPILFGALGFFAGVVFSAVLGLFDGRRQFRQMSLLRFAVWGAIGGLLLSAAFVLAVATGGDTAFIQDLVVIATVFAIATAGSAAGSLALARRAPDRALLEATDDATALNQP